MSLLVGIAKGKLVLVSDPLDAAMYRTSYLRRGIGVLGCGAPVLLLVASMVSVVIAGDRPDTIGSVTMVVAIAIAALNFYLSAVQRLVFRRRNGSLDGYKHISGLPGIGSLVVVAGAVVGFGSGRSPIAGTSMIRRRGPAHRGRDTEHSFEVSKKTAP